MSPAKELAGWRFATPEEVHGFLAHFTGTPNGASNAPAVVRKLLRLLGGIQRNQPDPQTGWLDNRITVRIAGITPIAAAPPPGGDSSAGPAGQPRLMLRTVFIGEMVKDGHSVAGIDPDQPVSLNSSRDIGLMVNEGLMRYAGFFLVRERTSPGGVQ